MSKRQKRIDNVATILENGIVVIPPRKGKPMETAYFRFGKRYRKLKRDEIIQQSAMQSWCCGELQPIMDSDGQTIGRERLL